MAETKPKTSNSSKTVTKEQNTSITKAKKPKMKPRGGNSPIIADANRVIEPSKASFYAGFISTIISWPKVDRKDLPALEARLTQYLNYCNEMGMKVGNQMCYLALGIDKDTVYHWEHDNGGRSEYCEFIKKVKFICASYREALMQDGQINPVTGLFWQKNYDGLKDQQEVVLTPNNPLGDATDPEALKQKYLEATYDSLPEAKKEEE